MTIKKDLSDLPVSTPAEAEGWPPIPLEDQLATPIMEFWMEHRPNHREKAIPGTRFRGSDAGSCARALGYIDQNEPVTNPPTWADYYRMDLGTLVHNQVQAMAEQVWGDHVQVEVVTDYRPDINGSGHGDMAVRIVFDAPGDDGIVVIRRIHVEIKTVNGFKFRNMIGAGKAPAKGPGMSHVLQASLNARHDACDEMRLMYFSMENTGKYRQDGEDPHGMGLFTAEWAFNRTEIERFATLEAERVGDVFDQVDAGTFPDRNVLMDDGSIVTIEQPLRGLWVRHEDGFIVDNGKTWQCDYCRYRDRCIDDGPGQVPIPPDPSPE